MLINPSISQCLSVSCLHVAASCPKTTPEGTLFGPHQKRFDPPSPSWNNTVKLFVSLWFPALLLGAQGEITHKNSKCHPTQSLVPSTLNPVLWFLASEEQASLNTKLPRSSSLSRPPCVGQQFKVSTYLSKLQTHPNLHSPVWVEPVGQMVFIPSERVQIWVCLFLYGWCYPGVRLQILVCLICVISPYSNWAVQIRVGLELAE